MRIEESPGIKTACPKDSCGEENKKSPDALRPCFLQYNVGHWVWCYAGRRENPHLL
jgi:hypothetical protein